MKNAQAKCDKQKREIKMVENSYLFRYIKMSIKYILYNILGFPCSSVGKESACNAGDSGSILGLGRSPGEGNGNPLQYFMPGESHGQRSLAGYKQSMGLQELDTTQQLNQHHHTISYNTYSKCKWPNIASKRIDMVRFEF